MSSRSWTRKRKRRRRVQVDRTSESSNDYIKLIKLKRSGETLPVEIQSNTLEARVLRVLLKKYPITKEELLEKVGVSEKKLDRVLKGFLSRGFITIEPLSDKTYIRLARMDFMFLGRKETQKKALKHVKEKKKRYKRVGDQASDDMMYR